MANHRDSTKAIRDVRRRLVEQGPDQQRNDEDFERVSLPYADGEVLRDLMIDENAMAVIEIGLAYGTSALAIGEALTLRGSATTSHLISTPSRTNSRIWDGMRSPPPVWPIAHDSFVSGPSSLFPASPTMASSPMPHSWMGATTSTTSSSTSTSCANSSVQEDWWCWMTASGRRSPLPCATSR